MKKLTAFFAVFILIASAAFAQNFSTNAMVKMGMEIIGSEPDYTGTEDLAVRWAHWQWSFGFSYTNLFNTAGAFGSISYYNAMDDSPNITGSAWWMPLPEVRFKIGDVVNDEFAWAKGRLTAWDLQATELAASPVFWFYNGYAGSILPEYNGFFAGTYIGDHRPALAIFINPFILSSLDQFSINLAFPHILYGGPPYNTRSDAKEAFIDHAIAQIVYGKPGFGSFAFTYGGSLRSRFASHYPQDTKAKTLFLQFEKARFGNTRYEVGFNYTYTPDDEPNWPIEFAVGWQYGNFWNDDSPVLTARIGGRIPIQDNTKYMDSHPAFMGLSDLRFGGDFTLNLRIGTGLRFYLPVGLAMIIRDEKYMTLPDLDEKFLFAWCVNPYVAKWLAAGLELCGGLRLYNGTHNVGWNENGPLGPFPVIGTAETPDYGGGINAANKNRINWSVPVYLSWRRM